MSLYTISKEPSSGKLKPQTFMVVAEKDICASVSGISTFLDGYDVKSHGDKAREFYKALRREEKFRSKYCEEGCDKLNSLKEVLNLGNQVQPCRMIKLILFDPAGHCSYEGVLVDAQQDSDHFFVLFVPRDRADEWLYSSEEGQKQIAADENAASVLIVFGNILLFKGDGPKEVIFALKKESQTTENDLSEACDKLEISSPKVANDKWTKRVIKTSKMIRPLK